MPDWNAELAISIWKQLPRAGSLKKSDKDYIIRQSEKYASIPCDDLRAAMVSYAGAVTEKPLPLAPFWNNPRKWIPSETAQDGLFVTGAHPTLAEVAMDAPRPASGGVFGVPAAGGVPVPDLIRRWNQLCPSAPATERIANTPDWTGCRTLAELVDAWDEVAAKAQSVREASDAGWLNLPFLLRTKAGLAQANWQRLLAGDFDPREKRTGGRDDAARSAMSEWLEAIDAIEQEWLSAAHDAVGEVEERRRRREHNQTWRESQESAYMQEVAERRQRFIDQNRFRYVEQVVATGSAIASLARVFDADPEAQRLIQARLRAQSGDQKERVQ
jgi:hypothetical protein